MQMTRVLRHPQTLFFASAALLVAFAIGIVRSHAFLAHPDVLAWGLTFDLTLTAPAAWYFFLIRPGRVRPLTIVPIFLGAVAIATRVIPASQQDFLHQLRWIAAPLELAAIVMAGRRSKGIVASELAVLRYALFGWRTPPERGFSVHERSGWGTIVACVIVLIAAESIGAHLLIQLWSVKAAWIMTALDAWGILWLLGDYNALRIRRIAVDADALHLRYGLRWTATIPRDTINSVAPVTEESQWKRKGVLKVALLDAPALLVTLREPAVIHGIAGIKKSVDAIAILPDDIEGFLACVRGA
jgi:hypothetical protein